MNYRYGMLNRPMNIGCQPKGAIDRKDAEKLVDGYHDIIVYDRQLTEDEIYRYELQFISEIKA